MKSAPRLTIVAYAVNGSGLGHLTRVLAVLRWTRRLAKLAGYTLDAHVLTSSEACALAFEEGFAAWKIPSKTAVRATEMDKQNYLRLARQWVWHSLGLLNPDLLLVDTFPGGSFGELWHALDGPSRKVLIKRAMKPEFAALPAVRGVLPFYDCFIVPDERDAPDATLEDAELAARVRHLGPIMLRSRAELRPRAEARQRLGVPDGKLAVYLSAGGGGDATAADALASLVDNLCGEPDLHLVVGAGPLSRSAPRRGPNITWLNGFHAMQDFLGLDLAISAAGFNAFHELLHAGVPTAFFAQEKIADEQARRVRVAAEAGCALALDAPAGVPERTSLQQVLTQLRVMKFRKLLSGKAQKFVPENAAREAAYETLATLLPHRVLDDAYEVGTEDFFLNLAQTGATPDDFTLLARALPLAADWEAWERRDALLDFFAKSSSTDFAFTATTAARLARSFCVRFAPPVSAEQSETLLEAAWQMLHTLALFADERGARSVLPALAEKFTMSAEERARPDVCAAVWGLWLQEIYAAGGSLATARAKLERAEV